jgi:hypothetical protein
MKNPLLPLAFAAAVFAAGCSTTNSRISRHQADFNTWPADVRAKIQAGRVDIGFTPEMVQVALGDPMRESTRTTAQGTVELWTYADNKPKFSIGLGVGGGTRSGVYGGGVVVGDNGFRDGERMRVVFDGGRVVAVETRQ